MNLTRIRVKERKEKEGVSLIVMVEEKEGKIETTINEKMISQKHSRY